MQWIQSLNVSSRIALLAISMSLGGQDHVSFQVLVALLFMCVVRLFHIGGKALCVTHPHNVF